MYVTRFALLLVRIEFLMGSKIPVWRNIELF